MTNIGFWKMETHSKKTKIQEKFKGTCHFEFTNSDVIDQNSKIKIIEKIENLFKEFKENLDEISKKNLDGKFLSITGVIDRNEILSVKVDLID